MRGKKKSVVRKHIRNYSSSPKRKKKIPERYRPGSDPLGLFGEEGLTKEQQRFVEQQKEAVTKMAPSSGIAFSEKERKHKKIVELSKGKTRREEKPSETIAVKEVIANDISEDNPLYEFITGKKKKKNFGGSS